MRDHEADFQGFFAGNEFNKSVCPCPFASACVCCRLPKKPDIFGTALNVDDELAQVSYPHEKIKHMGRRIDLARNLQLFWMPHPCCDLSRAQLVRAIMRC